MYGLKPVHTLPAFSGNMDDFGGNESQTVPQGLKA
jgi:hypothetical protein